MGFASSEKRGELDKARDFVQDTITALKKAYSMETGPWKSVH